MGRFKAAETDLIPLLRRFGGVALLEEYGEDSGEVQYRHWTDDPQEAALRNEIVLCLCTLTLPPPTLTATDENPYVGELLDMQRHVKQVMVEQQSSVFGVIARMLGEELAKEEDEEECELEEDGSDGDLRRMRRKRKRRPVHTSKPLLYVCLLVRNLLRVSGASSVGGGAAANTSSSPVVQQQQLIRLLDKNLLLEGLMAVCQMLNCDTNELEDSDQQDQAAETLLCCLSESLYAIVKPYHPLMLVYPPPVDPPRYDMPNLWATFDTQVGLSHALFASSSLLSLLRLSLLRLSLLLVPEETF